MSLPLLDDLKPLSDSYGWRVSSFVEALKHSLISPYS